MSPKENLFISSVTKDVGSRHPIEEMKNKLVNIMESFGFSYEEGPEIETEENNFDMLNIKKNHPARQMHDTFYVENRSFVLRTHTSPVQIRSMLKLDPPISIVSAGKVFRKDGTLMAILQYKDGSLQDLTQKFYYPNGKIQYYVV